MRLARGTQFLISVALLLVAAGCSDAREETVFAVRSSVADSSANRGLAMTSGDPSVINLPVEARLRITLLERDGAALHALSISYPRDTLLAGPGYLFPGPTFDVGPYPAGAVGIRLDVYNNYPPHEFWGIAASQIEGTYPNWTIRYEDSSDNDYNDIVIGVQAFPEDLSLSCTPSSVQRAMQPVSCVPSVPQGSTLDVTGWRFVGGPNNQFQVTPPGAAPPTWDGLMVVSGTVWVHANVNGVPDSASAAVSVMPRSWATPPMDNPAPELPQSQATDMPVVPAVDHDLGHAHQELVFASGYPDSNIIKAVQGGPNYLLFYNDTPPVTRIKAWTEINRDGLTNSNNPWYQAHPRNRQTDAQGRPICRQQDLRNTILGMVVSHEADHITFARNWWPNNNLNAAAESVVSDQGTQAVADATVDALSVGMTAENAANSAAVDPVAFPCVLLF